MPRRRASVLVACLLTVSACQRSPSGGAPPAGSPASPASPAASASPARSGSSGPAASAPSALPGEIDGDPYDEASLLPPLFAEAPRRSAAHPGFREVLRPVMAQIEARFPGADPASLEVQIAAMPDAERALLVGRKAPGPRPLLFAFDAQRQLLWSRERPLGGLDSNISEFALCPGPGGDLLVAWYDTPTQRVAARRWDKAGWLIADFKVLAAEGVSTLSALHWPGQGWLMVTSGKGALRAQLLTEGGKLPWGSDGRTIAPQGALDGPLSLALDTELSAVVVWKAPSAAAGSRAPQPHHLAQRIDVDGALLLKAPADLGEASSRPEKPQIERLREGVVRVDLTRDGGPYAVELTAEGQVLLR